VAITCEAHIDDAEAIVKHLQLQRFDRFIALFGGLHAISGTAPIRCYYRVGGGGTFA
jgi:hypothetical protein